MMLKAKLTSSQEDCLRDQVITADEPSPVLRDFRVVLDFVGLEGVEAKGKYNLLPLKSIDELDRLMSRPLRLQLKRPQLRSHPYLQGLNLLLRASGLSRVEGLGEKSRLVLDPVMLERWDALNTTEQYFNLLEAWLRFGRGEMVGDQHRRWDEPLTRCVQAWYQLPKQGRRFDLKRHHDVYLPGIGRDFYHLALMDLFGLVKVEQPPSPITSWIPAGVKHLPFGDAVFTLLPSEYLAMPSLDARKDEDEVEEVDMDEDGEEEDVTPMLPVFGAWQPLFQPYFPGWRANLKLPKPERRKGTFLLEVSVQDARRLIAMPADATLDELARWILKSVKFDDDHLYEFNYRDRLGCEATVVHPAMDEGPWTSEVTIGTIPLEPGQAMRFRFDFGDDWIFSVKLVRIEPPAAKIKAPRILESHGKAPKQYSNWDD